jgi:hypothetical protein
MRTRGSVVTVLVLCSALLVSAAATDCTFLNNPDDFKVDPALRHRMRSDLVKSIRHYVDADTDPKAAAGASQIKRNNFIDESIFGRMATAGIQPAPLASDLEFLRRVTLDLTGRIPSAADVDAFLADTSPSKRDLKIDALIGSPEFVDKWTMFFGDLFKVSIQTQAVNRDPHGRDAFYIYVRDSIAQNKPYDQIARELITGTGDSFVQGESNWVLGNTVAMGPAQDTYDGQAANLASTFLGINVVDCLLCHDGARHLDTVNLWGSKQTRQNMWGLSAFFTRVRMQRQVVSTTPQVAKYIISEIPTGEYVLNTTTGNRTARQPVNGVSVVAPKNPFLPNGGTILNGENRRQAIARQITSDIQFSRALVNYVWEKLMVEAFVSPSNAFDPSRLDPVRLPPDAWPLQPTNAQLLESMSQWFQQNKYDLRALISLIAKSNAYQLSSSYPGQWDVSYVPYYARKYVRRLDAEEIHDAIAKATGILGNYTLAGSDLPPIRWAMQLPDTVEPRATAAATFMNAFGRGDRNTTFRRNDASLLQALNLMNNTFVDQRIGPNNSGSRVQLLLSQNANAQTIIRELYMNTLSRPPSADEINYFTVMFQQRGNRAAAESLQWILINKMDFVFNY